jgi:predicted hydrocarbon binding protein
MPKSRPKAPAIEPEPDLARLTSSEARDLLAAHMSIDVTEGALEAFHCRFMFMRPEVLVNIQKQLEGTVGASTKGFLYLAGERSGKDALHTIEGLVPTSQSVEPEFVKRLTDAGALFGWGRYEVIVMEPDGSQIILALTNSPIATSYGPSKKPVCHLLAGWLAGIVNRIFKKEFLCEETACVAQGRPRCEFRVRPMPFA